MKRIVSLLIVAVVFMSLKPMTKQDSANEKGKMLYYSNCGACHIIGRDIVAPDLTFVHQRWTDFAELVSYTQNPSKYEKENPNNTYVKELHKQYLSLGGMMPPQLLDSNECKLIYDYLKAVSDTTTAFGNLDLALKNRERVKTLNLNEEESKLVFDHLNCFRNLETLDLFKPEDVDKINTLAQLPKLKKLLLFYPEFKKQKVDIKSFPALRKLDFVKRVKHK
jgi:cytochrome c2